MFICSLYHQLLGMHEQTPKLKIPLIFVCFTSTLVFSKEIELHCHIYNVYFCSAECPLRPIWGLFAPTTPLCLNNISRSPSTKLWIYYLHFIIKRKWHEGLYKYPLLREVFVSIYFAAGDLSLRPE